MTNTTKTSSALDPFDSAALRLDQSFADMVGVKKLLTTVPVRKPSRQDFVRVHRDPAYRLTPAAIIELREDHEVYLVTPAMASELPGEFAAATLFTTINRQGVLHLWPVKLPGPDGKHNEWHRSLAEGARTGDGQVGADHREHVARRVRGVRGDRRPAGAYVARSALPGHPQGRVPGAYRG
jgi:hypothetical protein